MTLAGLMARMSERHDEPFPHLVIDGVLPSGLADDVLAWMETTASWIPREERFYRSDNIHFSPANLPPELASLLSTDARRDLRLALEDHFRHKFLPTLHVSANRYRPGQGTLIHTDFVPSHFERDRFFFTHRFLVYFLRDWDAGRGGALGLFASTDVASLMKTIDPIHNRGVGLVIGPRSYHAVAAVHDGERYTINICLRSVTGEYEKARSSPWH
jgi:hypothetical protein